MQADLEEPLSEDECDEAEGGGEVIDCACDELHDDLGDFMDEHITSAVHTPDDVGIAKRTQQARMKAVVRAYQSSALGCENPVAFWSEGGDGRAFTKLVRGGRSLLKFSSGNGKLERVFSHAIQVFCDVRRKNFDLRQLLMLLCNAASCGLPDFRSIW